jgi:hypothetical protein
MGRQLMIITETRKRKFFIGPFPKFYHETDFLPQQQDRFDEAENAIRVDMLNHIYNYRASDLTPHEIIHKGKPHHSEAGDPCADECVCGHSNSRISKFTNKTTIKTHSDFLMKFSDNPLPEYLIRVAYNKKNNINVVVELWDTDERYNPISLVKKIAP